MLVRPTKRTLTSFVLRALVPRVAVFGTGAAILLLGQALALETSSTTAAVPAERVAQAAPAWSAADSAAYPECTPSGDWPAGAPADFVVVHSFRDDADHKLAFDRAWALNHNDTEVDDLWVVGVCGDR